MPHDLDKHSYVTKLNRAELAKSIHFLRALLKLSPSTFGSQPSVLTVKATFKELKSYQCVWGEEKRKQNICTEVNSVKTCSAVQKTKVTKPQIWDSLGNSIFI